MPFTQEVEGSTPTGGTCPNDFSDPVDQDIRTQYTLSYRIVVSEWRSVIAVSLNVGDGVRLIKLAKLYICTQTHYKHDEDGRSAPDVCVHGSIGERRYENWILTYLNCQISLPPFISWKEGYRKDDYTVDCPHLTKKRLCKTRIVDFHREKLALLAKFYCHIFKVLGILSFPVGNSTTKKISNFSVVCVCEGGGGGGGGWRG